MIRKNLYKIFNERGFKVGAEIGVYTGVNAFSMFKCIPDLKLYLIDPWDLRKTRPYFRRVVREIAKNYYDAIIIRRKSEDAARFIEDGSLDFVYIDANHQYDYVMLDQILWSRKVRNGGIVSGHDYYTRKRGNLGVKVAVDDYVRYHKIDLKLYKRNWYWEK